MDFNESEMEEDESEWKTCFMDPAALCPSTIKTPEPAQKVILHFDLDCFYAQVEMIRNPALRDVPLGIQQKYIIVTCNYVAREQGVTKLMSVTDAKEKCPKLVLVKGEDLTHYREMSYKVTEVLLSYCPLVERLGFDENFVDVTELVEQRLAQTSQPDSLSFKGHVFNHSSKLRDLDHPRLAIGSHIAAELREAIHSKLGLTGCAGVATNKLLAKLVSGTFKPNQQTVLLQENIGDIMGCLSGLRKVPGVGHQTAKRLQALGLMSVKDLQLYPLNDLAREFGGGTAQRLKNLALGIDDSAVTPTGAPQSLSDEDSFKKMCSVKEVMEKIHELLSSLVERMHKDGRQPQTFRLTIRKYSATNKWFSRESRQCPIPGSTGQKILSVLKMYVSLSPLKEKKESKTSIAFPDLFLSHLSLLQSVNSCSRIAPANNKVTTKDTCGQSLHVLGLEQSSVYAAEENHQASCSTERISSNETKPPPNVDPEVFKLLPEEIQKEILSPSYFKSQPSPSASETHHMSTNKPQEKDLPMKVKSSKNVTENLSLPQSSDCNFPGNVDPKVFSELPSEVQKELLAEWKQQKPILKTPSSRKPGKASTSKGKDRKAEGRASQSNNLFKYFKPG
uniref:Polymerase (DNA directed) iota n=1 Tax=Cyprinodon variegatus TaxID=28743 RepID=A0A3Q2D349_CYPVA